jgi:signal transduction histidine kinase
MGQVYVSDGIYFRIVQAALANVARHAEASQAVVALMKSKN